MRKLIITENITVDGVIEFLGDWFSPAEDENTTDILAALREQDATADATLLGRQTFEDFRAYWPKQTDDRTGITDYLNRVTKYVVSTGLTDSDWENTVVLTGDLLDKVSTLKQQPGRDIVCTGSIRLVHALVPSGLVDEYRLFVHPVVSGAGRRLFPEGTEIPRLQLLETRRFRSGVVLLRYQPG